MWNPEIDGGSGMLELELACACKYDSLHCIITNMSRNPTEYINTSIY